MKHADEGIEIARKIASECTELSAMVDQVKLWKNNQGPCKNFFYCETGTKI